MSRYLDRLRELSKNPQKHPPEELTKLTKAPFVSFVSDPGRGVCENGALPVAAVATVAADAYPSISPSDRAAQAAFWLNMPPARRGHYIDDKGFEWPLGKGPSHID